MPLKRAAKQQGAHVPRGQEEEREEAGAKRSKPEPVEDGSVEPGRPYREYVESRLRQYMRDQNFHSLVKPAQEEIRAAAMPIKLAAQRRRTGWSPLTMAHHAVAAMHLHAAESGQVRPPYSRPASMPGYHEALISLADDTGLLAREIPLPAHPSPEHPVIYCTVNLNRNRPVPREDALIRGDYVYTRAGRRITRAEHIHPWPAGRHQIQDRSTLLSLGWDACYTLYRDANNTWHILFLWTEPVRLVHGIPVLNRSFIGDLIFSPPSSFIIAVPDAE